MALAFSSIVTWTCYRFGAIYGGITGDPAIDGYALGALDITKWFLPAAARSLRSRGSKVAGNACWLLDAVLIGCSLYAGVTMAGYGKSTAVAQRTLANTTVADLRAELSAHELELAALGPARPVNAALADVNRHKSSSNWTASNGCAEPVVPGAQRYCAEYHRLFGLLAAAQRADELRGKIEALLTQIRAATTLDSARPTNAVLAAIERFTTAGPEAITAGWALVLVFALEAFSATVPSAVWSCRPRSPSTPAQGTTGGGEKGRVKGRKNRCIGPAPAPPAAGSRDPASSAKPRGVGVPPRVVQVRSSTGPSPGSTVEGSLEALLAIQPDPSRPYRFEELMQAHVEACRQRAISPLAANKLALALYAVGFEKRKTRDCMIYQFRDWGAQGVQDSDRRASQDPAAPCICRLAEQLNGSECRWDGGDISGQPNSAG